MLSNAALAALWGLISAISLVLGAAIGLIVRQPGRLVQGSILAFGGGALIEALSIELFGHILHLQEAGGGLQVVAVAAGGGLFGGCFFTVIGKWLNIRGGFMRNRMCPHDSKADLYNSLTAA